MNPQKIKELQLTLLDEFARICTRKGIKWFLDGGTLLGAARNAGYIPWDDDIDVILPRIEYDRLCKAAVEFMPPFFFQTDKTDPGSMRGHAQLRLRGTKAILENEMIGDTPLFDFEQGIFIDIFVLDRLPDEAKSRAEFQRSISMMKKRAMARRLERAQWRRRKLLANKRIPWWRFLFGAIWCALGQLGIDIPRFLFRRFEDTVRTYSDLCIGEWCGPILWQPERPASKLLPIAIYQEPPVQLNFEGRFMPAPAQYEKVLEILYGVDWRIPRKYPSCHGGVKFE